ncbi:hypothetical protein Tco_1452931, partial [Tanacetum coccineum]
MPALEDYSIFDFTRNDEDDGVEADINYLDTIIQVIPNPTTRIHKDRPLDQVIGDLQSATQIRNMSQNLKEHERTRKFVDTHNMVAFLSKPVESEGFEQIVDFLNANPIRYAPTINPTIYTSCIQQLWATIKVKTVNGKVHLQALVDRKKIIITESTVRRDLQLEDAEGVDCLPNATIFEQLTLMGYEKISQKLSFYKAFFSPQWKFLIHTILHRLNSKTTVWNKFSSTMASAIICLATNQEFNFSKYIFESMVKNLDNKQRHRKSKRKDTEIPQSSGPTNNVADEAVNKEMDDSLERAATTATSLDAEQDRGGGSRRQETMRDTIAQTRFENVSKTSNDPLLTRETTKTTQANEIASLKRSVKKLERRNKSRTHRLKRIYRVGSSRMVESFEDEGLGEEDASKQGRIADINANKDIYLVNVCTDEDMFDVNYLDGDEDKGKGIMIEEPVVEQVKPMKRLEQIRLDKELSFKLQAK